MGPTYSSAENPGERQVGSTDAQKVQDYLTSQSQGPGVGQPGHLLFYTAFLLCGPT